MPLLPKQRQQLILDQLRHTGAVQTTPLARQLGTSTVTVRRDIDALIERGIATRVYGGAVLAAARAGHTAGDTLPATPGMTWRPTSLPTAIAAWPTRPAPATHSPRAIPRTNGDPTTIADAAAYHFRTAQHLLAVAESRLRRNQPKDAQEWRSLAELHIRLAEYAGAHNPNPAPGDESRGWLGVKPIGRSTLQSSAS
jgi:hypothetical protein